MSDELVIKKGNPYDDTIVIENEDGSRYDLTGKTVMFTVKELDDYSDTDSLALIQVNITNHTDPTQGETLLHIPAEDTNIDLEDKGQKYFKWDLRIYDAPDSSGEDLIQVNSDTGSCKIVDIVTKRTN